MRPRYLPPTFLFLTSGSMGSEKDWSINVMFISPSGGTIEFKQGTSEYDGGERYPKRKEEARVEPTTVAGRPARFLRYEKPYSGVILAWEQEGIKYSLLSSWHYRRAANRLFCACFD